MRFLLCVGGCFLGALTMACDDDKSPSVETTNTPLLTASGSRTAPAPNGPAQGITGCPVDDDALCQLAVDLQNAVANGDVEFIESSLAPEPRPCAETLTFTDQEIGCESSDDTSDPVAPFFRYGSDCCYATSDAFVRMLRVQLGPPVDASWRIWGIIEGSPFWDGQPAVVLIRGAPDDRQVVELGTIGVGADVAVQGLILGTVGSMYVFPDATLLPWQ